MAAPMPMPTTNELEVFADILCPFTHVGLHRLVVERARRHRDLPRLRVRAWPLELVNGSPMTGLAVAERVAALREQVAPDLFAGFDPAHAPSTTRPALALAAAAYRRDVAVGESVSLALRDALFEAGLDISDPSVLAGVAQRHGVGPVTQGDVASIDADWAEGAARGVVGSPHFFVDGASYFCPTLQIRRVDGLLDIRLDEPAYDEFITCVFAEPASVPS